MLPKHLRDTLDAGIRRSPKEVTSAISRYACHRCGKQIELKGAYAIPRPFVIFHYCRDCYEIVVEEQ